MNPYGTGPRRMRVVLAAAALLLLAGCAAGPASKWAPPAEAAGFFAGFWHGLLILVTLVVSFFTDNVRIYEIHNTGIGYDIGFVLGVLGVSGGGVKVSGSCSSKPKPRRSDPDWDEIGEQIERTVRAKISKIVEEEDWQDIGEQVEQKVKEGLRRWLDEDPKDA